MLLVITQGQQVETAVNSSTTPFPFSAKKSTKTVQTEAEGNKGQPMGGQEWLPRA